MNRKTKILLAVSFVAVAFVALFDWNWLRRPLVSYIAEKSGREITMEDLHVELGFVPTIRLRGLHIQNAPWAGERPFATAAEASFTVSLESLWKRRPVISRLVLVDAEVDMQREADGRRNWRLRDPEDRSPGRVRVETLEAHRSRIHFTNRATDFHLIAASTPVENPQDGLKNRVSIEGTYKGVAFSGEAVHEGALSFRDSGVTFASRGHVVWRKTRVEFDGLFTDIFDIGPFDAKLRVSGDTLSELHPFLRLRPAPSRSYAAEAQLTQVNRIYEFRHLRGKIGQTDLAGEATFDRSGARPVLHASLMSDRADLADLRSLVGMRPVSGRRAATSSTASSQGERAEAGSGRGRFFPGRPLRVERLNSFDARVTLQAKKLTAAQLPLQRLQFAAELGSGLLEVKSLDLGFAGGRVVGLVSLDARQQPPSSRVALEFRGVRLEQLVPHVAAKARGTGAIRGQIKLAGEGDSAAAMIGNANGSVAALLEAGRISNLADAKLALNIGKVLGLMVRGDREIAIHCAVAVFDVRRGTGKSRALVLDTAQTYTAGAGQVNLRDEHWNLLLTPQPKKPGLLVKEASIRVSGSFSDPRVSLEERAPVDRSQPATSNGNGSPGANACAAAMP